jgi:hypothetical protein
MEHSEGLVVAGPLTAEDRRVFRRLWWAPSVRPYQILTLVGLAILAVSWIYLILVELTVSLHSGITTAMVSALVLLFVGFAVMAAGLGLRGRATRKIAYRACPVCQAVNLWLSAHCSKCGAALPAVTVT